MFYSNKANNTNKSDENNQENQINAENLKKNLIGSGNEDALSENNINNNSNNYPIVLSNNRKTIFHFT